ncbi:7337_t:CDS:2 [Cetraspora pellucida]|uniref:7337_t:CDS:1 n=1 Tax=Cetraspora pellucida TaxID=1433469 RepID=A0A9N8ZL50_9GLOM|nr:7337_t:CDS:2 [Cetraspora pellucida]
MPKRTTLTDAQKFINPNAKHHRVVTYPELDYALREFVLIYQNQTILSDTILVEKAKILANGLGIPEDALQFSHDWLSKFKERNNIRQHKLEGEAKSADEAAIITALPTLRNKCSNYPIERIYNMNETELFYSLMNNIHQTEDLTLDNLTNALKDLHIHLTDPMPVEEFLSIPDEDVVYEVPRDDQVIEQLIETFKPVYLTYDDSEEDDNVEISLISINAVITSLETVYMFLLQQDKGR